MQDWGYAQAHPSEQLARIHHFSMCKVEPEREIEITITVKEFFTPKDPALLQWLWADKLYLQVFPVLKHVDVLFFSPTEHNMHVDPSVILINEQEPQYILPQHRDTYRVTPQNRYWTSGYPFEVKLRLSKPQQERFHILKQGEKVEIKRE